LRLGWACYYRRSYGRHPAKADWFYFDTHIAFWQFVFEHTENKIKLWLIARNLTFDFTVLKGWRHLRKAKYKLKFFHNQGTCNIISVRNKSKSIVFLDSMNWRTVNELEKKKGLMRFVRKDYYPAKVAMAEVEWALSQEYMYKVKVESRLRPDVPITERFVNIMSDTPMTAAMVEQAVTEKWVEWEDYTAEAIEKMQVWTAVHRAAI
ncbi:unnamed protein product, partial [marine sediment metagenome]